MPHHEARPSPEKTTRGLCQFLRTTFFKRHFKKGWKRNTSFTNVSLEQSKRIADTTNRWQTLKRMFPKLHSYRRTDNMRWHYACLANLVALIHRLSRKGSRWFDGSEAFAGESSRAACTPKGWTYFITCRTFKVKSTFLKTTTNISQHFKFNLCGSCDVCAVRKCY